MLTWQKDRLTRLRYDGHVAMGRHARHRNRTFHKIPRPSIMPAVILPFPFVIQEKNRTMLIFLFMFSGCLVPVDWTAQDMLAKVSVLLVSQLFPSKRHLLSKKESAFHFLSIILLFRRLQSGNMENFSETFRKFSRNSLGTFQKPEAFREAFWKFPEAVWKPSGSFWTLSGHRKRRFYLKSNRKPCSVEAFNAHSLSFRHAFCYPSFPSVIHRETALPKFKMSEALWCVDDLYFFHITMWWHDRPSYDQMIWPWDRIAIETYDNMITNVDESGLPCLFSSLLLKTCFSRILEHSGLEKYLRALQGDFLWRSWMTLFLKCPF